MASQTSHTFPLNDDCLDLVLKKLPLGDRINLALSSERCFDVFSMRSKIDFKSSLKTHFFNTLKTCQIKVLLMILGPQIKQLVIDFPFEDLSYLMDYIYLNLLVLFCKNLETLICSEWSVNDNDVQLIRAFENLRCLEIVNNVDVTGEHIYELKRLHKLTLNNCSAIQTQYFNKIFTNLENLHTLDIRNCNRLRSENFEKIFQNLKNLESLKISTTNEDYKCLAQLPKLKKFEVWRNNILSPGVSKEFLQDLAKYQCHRMEELKIADCASFDVEKAKLVAKFGKLKVLHCICNPCDNEMLLQFSKLEDFEELVIDNCYFVSSSAVLQLLENCHKVKYLNLRYCNILSSDLIPRALSLLQLRCQLRNNDNEKGVKFRKISYRIVEIKVEDSLNFLKFSYKYMRPDYECNTKTIQIFK